MAGDSIFAAVVRNGNSEDEKKCFPLPDFVFGLSRGLRSGCGGDKLLLWYVAIGRPFKIGPSLLRVTVRHRGYLVVKCIFDFHLKYTNGEPLKGHIEGHISAPWRVDPMA